METFFICALLTFLVLVGWDILGRLVEIKYRLEKIEKQLKPARLARIEVYAVVDGQIQEDITMAKVTAKISFVAKGTDVFGNEVPSGPFVLALLNPEMGSLEMQEDGKSAKFIPSGKLGSLVCGAEANGKHGESAPLELEAGDIELIAVETIVE
jgi:hypothetical protein